MASVYKHTGSKSPYWIAVYADENGKQRHRSTKETSKTRALEIAAKLERTAKELRRAKKRRGEVPLPGSEQIFEMLVEAAQLSMEGKFTITHARRCIDRLLEISGQAQIASITTASFLKDWLASTKPTVSEGTYASYEEKVESFLEFLGSRGDQSIDTVLVKDAEQYRLWLLDSKIAKTTVNLKMKILTTPFRVARKMGYIAVNPFELVKAMPARNAEKKAFTLDQLTLLLDAADNEWKGMILVGASTGMRITDAASLKWKNVDLERGTIVIFPKKNREREQAKSHETIILPDLADYLLELKAGRPNATSGEPLFPSLHGKNTGGLTGLSLTFRELMTKAGIESEVSRERQKGGRGRTVYELGFHSLRHSCTSIMANTGVREEIRKKLVGHTSDVHQRYTHFELETFKQELSKFPRLLSASI